MKSKLFVLILFPLLIPFYSFSQNTNFTQDSIKAVNLFIKGRNFFFQNPDSSIIYLTRVEDLLIKYKRYDLYVGSINALSYLYFKNANFVKYDFYAQKGVKEGNTYLKPDDEIYLSALNNLATAYIRKSNFDQAFKIYNEVLKNWKNNESQLASCYTNLGYLFTKKKDYQKALLYYQKSLNWKLANTPDNITGIINSSYSIAKVYTYKQDNEKAKSLFKTCLIQLEKDLENKNLRNYINVYQSLAQVYVDENNLDSTNFFLNQAEKKVIQKNNYQIEVNYILKAQIYQQEGDISKATKYHKKALDRRKTIVYNNIPHHPRIAESYDAIGLLHLEAKEFEKSLTMFDSAIQTLNPNLNNTNTKEVLELEEVKDKTVYLPILKHRAEAYMQWHYKTLRSDYLDLAESSYLQANYLIKEIRKNILNEASKYELSKEAISIYEGKIRLHKTQFDLTNDPIYLTKLFQASEQTKSILLLEGLNEYEVKNTLGLPPTVLAKENQLTGEITYLEGKRFSIANGKKSYPDSILRNIDNQLFSLIEQRDSLRQHLETTYPQYYQLKYQSTTISPQDIQSQFASDQAMIEYFRGDSATYAFVITKQDFWVKELPNHDSIQTWVNQMREGLYHYWLGGEKTKELRTRYNQRYVDYAHRLHQTLIEPLRKDGTDLPEKLVFIPDGVLGYLPFDALLSEKPSIPEHFGTHPYLLNSHQISYAYSAALWKDGFEEKKSSKAGEEMLAIGPTFGEQNELFASVDELRSGGFAPLIHNKKEVQNINKLFGGELLLDQQATKASFLEQAPNFRFIHLSTHAKANDSDSRFSRIAFTPINDTTEENDFLTLAEISNLHLSAEMVTLSACETALGELQRGEGIMSLARAFTYAGAKSIITTLWSVNDGATADLMTRFYGHLAEGLTKDAALRQARLDFIQNSDHEFSHPFFWAAAVPMGDMSAIDGKLNDWIWIGGILVLLLLIGIWMMMRNKNS